MIHALVVPRERERKREREKENEWTRMIHALAVPHRFRPPQQIGSWTLLSGALEVEHLGSWCQEAMPQKPEHSFRNLEHPPSPPQNRHNAAPTKSTASSREGRQDSGNHNPHTTLRCLNQKALSMHRAMKVRRSYRRMYI